MLSEKHTTVCCVLILIVKSSTPICFSAYPRKMLRHFLDLHNPIILIVNIVSFWKVTVARLKMNTHGSRHCWKNEMAILFVHIPGFNFNFELSFAFCLISGLISFHCCSVRIKSNVSNSSTSSVNVKYDSSLSDSLLSDFVVFTVESKRFELLFRSFFGNYTHFLSGYTQNRVSIVAHVCIASCGSPSTA